MNEDLIALYADESVPDDAVVLGGSDDPNGSRRRKRHLISTYYNSGKTGRGANILKFWLMPFVCIVAFGFPFDAVGTAVSTLSQFVAPAFFILSGFFVLGTDRDARLEKLKRAIRRSGRFFLMMFAVYFAINIVLNIIEGASWISEIFRVRVAFNFFVLNLWPFSIGQNIWFIESLFFAYILLFLMDKLKILRFYKLLLIPLIAFMLVSGEFAGLFNFHILDYAFIPGNTVTRALPYLLIGMLIREKADRILDRGIWVYLLFIVGGLGLAHLEMSLLYNAGVLYYSGHMIGYGLTAAGLCCLALAFPDGEKTFTSVHGRNYARRIYFLCHMVAYGLLFAASAIGTGAAEIVSSVLGIATYVVCLILSFLIGMIRFRRYDDPGEDNRFMDEIREAM